jgi:hypothetical protein
MQVHGGGEVDEEVDEEEEVDGDEGMRVKVRRRRKSMSMQCTSQPVPEMSTSQGGTSPLPHHHYHGGMNGPSSSVDALRAVLTKIVGLCTNVQLGMAKVFITVTQAVFTSTLASGLRAQIPGIDPTMIRDVEATQVWGLVPAADVRTLLAIYNNALTRTYLVDAAMAAASIVGVVGIGLKRIQHLEEGAGKGDQESKESSVEEK